jgi:enoyl-CoA hydratase/carnithine racemase
VNGAALAGGFEIVLACDLVVASSEATFGLPEVKRGLAAAAGGIFRLPRMIPRNLALEVIATGRAMPAERAHELGLVNQIVPQDQVLKEAIALAETISENAPLAVQWSLEIARRAFDLDASQLRRETAEMSDRLFATEDAREGPLAFAEKRLPQWTGLAAPTPDNGF